MESETSLSTRVHPKQKRAASERGESGVRGAATEAGTEGEEAFGMHTNEAAGR